MAELIVTDQQARILSGASGQVAIRDVQGHVLGYFIPHTFSPEEIEQAVRSLATQQPRYTTQQVLDHLQSLGDG